LAATIFLFEKFIFVGDFAPPSIPLSCSLPARGRSRKGFIIWRWLALAAHANPMGRNLTSASSHGEGWRFGKCGDLAMGMKALRFGWPAMGLERVAAVVQFDAADRFPAPSNNRLQSNH
ncbi:MAG TPA: hypothetical protein PKD54_16465, partial [Pirellulaceae bacterium]|nr:hypothetical protein [Pirellulaceae bacterium]